MTLLKRKRVLAAKVETTPGTAIALSASDGAMNVYNPMIQMGIAMDEREGQGSFGYLASVPGPFDGTATFRTDIAWDGTGIPAWASLLFPACGYVLSTDTFYPKTEAPGSNVKTLTIGCYVDGLFKSIRGAVGNFKIVCPTAKMAYIDWNFRGIWVIPTDVTIIDPTYLTAEIPIRAAGYTTTFGGTAICTENVTFDPGNELTLRECTTDTLGSGYVAGIITNRNPKITANPEAKLVATRAPFTQFLARTEGIFLFKLQSSTGNGLVTITAPKAQLINVQEGDRNRIVTDELEFQCNRNGNTEDQELSITFTDDS